VEVLVVSQHDVPDLLPMDECIDAMAEALAALARGDAVMPLRSVLSLPDERGSLVTMPTILPEAGALGVKVITAFPGNQDTEFDSHQGAVLLFEAEHGLPVVIADATAITGIRTAAVSGLATRLLAREDATDLAIIGSGTQAGTHLEAMRAVRDIGRVCGAGTRIACGPSRRERPSATRWRCSRWRPLARPWKGPTSSARARRRTSRWCWGHGCRPGRT